MDAIRESQEDLGGIEMGDMTKAAENAPQARGRKQSFVMSIQQDGNRQYTARKKQAHSTVGNSIGPTFRAGCCVPLRLIFIKLTVVICALTVVIPLLYTLVYCLSGGKLKDIGGSIGLLLQPWILDRKAKKGKPRFNEIACKAPFKLFLGAQPDLLGGFRELFGNNNIRTVVSLNSEKERAGNCWARPPSERHYLRHDVNFVKITLSDHCPLTVPMLATSAESIHEGLQIGDVYVHCKAGQGRSAQSILAYLLKYEHETVDQAIAHMQRDRPNITLKTTAQVAKLKPKKKEKNQERHNFYQSFIRQYCDEVLADKSALAAVGNPLTKHNQKMIKESSVRTDTGFCKRYEVTV
jgi:hypothetical protein